MKKKLPGIDIDAFEGELPNLRLQQARARVARGRQVNGDDFITLMDAHVLLAENCSQELRDQQRELAELDRLLDSAVNALANHPTEGPLHKHLKESHDASRARYKR